MNVDDIFKNAYVITTQNSNRIKYIKKTLAENDINFNFIVAPDYHIIDPNFPCRDDINNNPQRYMSLTSAANSLIEMARISDLDSICIMEDDCFFVSNWKEDINIFLKSIPDDWDFLNLGITEECPDLETYNEYAKIIHGLYWGTHCIYYKKSIFNDFLQIYLDYFCDIPYDHLAIALYRNHKCYTPAKKLIRQISISDRAPYNKDVNSNIFFKSQIQNTKPPEKIK